LYVLKRTGGGRAPQYVVRKPKTPRKGYGVIIARLKPNPDHGDDARERENRSGSYDE
jgi:hypothetical protein